jgi:hypothetical protein
MRCGFRSLTVALWSVAEGYCGILAGVAGVPPPPTFGASPPRGGIRMKLSIDNHRQRS